MDFEKQFNEVYKNKKETEKLNNELLSIYEQAIDVFTIGVLLNYVEDNDIYSVHFYIECNGKQLSSLGLKKFETKATATQYFEELKFLIDDNNLESLFEMIE